MVKTCSFGKEEVMCNTTKQVSAGLFVLTVLATVLPASSAVNSRASTPPATQIVPVTQIVQVTQVVPVTQIVLVTRIVPAPDCALLFDGVSAYVDLGRWFDYDTFTLAMWVNPGDSQVAHADIIDNNHTDYRSWVLQQDHDRTNWYDWGVVGTSALIVFHLAANTWQHLAITHDAAGASRVYVNGSLIGMSTGLPSVIYDGTQTLSLARWGGVGRNWKGQLDEVQIWSSALTEEQIKNDMNEPLSETDEHLVGYYRFNECSGTVAHDSSTHEHDGRLVDDPSWVNSRLPWLAQ
jgi:hypothetical protein